MSSRVEAGNPHTVEFADGQVLRYSQSGRGEPLVLLHTMRTQLEYFRGIVPLLSERFTVYALDLPGHGYSSIDTSAAFDEPYLRAGVVSFIEALDLKNVTLAGESIGGVLAVTAASTLPGRVKAVIASNPYDYDRYYADGVRRGNLFANVVLGSYQVPLVGAINAALENRLFLAWVLKGGVADNRNLPSDLVAEFDRAGRRFGYRTVERKVFSGWRSWSAARALYANVNKPVTLIYGEQDWSRLEDRQATANALSGATVRTLADTGHFAVLERPREIADIIQATPS